MNIFSVISFIGGLAFFLYGMHVLSSGLERMAGGKLGSSLKHLTSNRFKALGLGAGITAAIQSSSVVTVMLVGLVNSGIITLRNSIGVIMGANIGTTMTAWILTLVGIESGNTFMKLLKPENFSLIFAFIGVLMIMASKKQKYQDIGRILVGFAVLMYGMKLMSSAVKPLADVPAFTNLFTAFKNPILGVLVGMGITAVIQSSSASVGILQALALTGSVSYGAAIPIIMGQNIGTCITAFISSFGVNRNAKKVAIIHVAFNSIGTVICLTAYIIANAFFHFAFTDAPIDAVGIAIVHTAFNLIITAILLPFTRQLEALANRILPDKSPAASDEFIDTRLLATPSVAITECNSKVSDMAKLAITTVNISLASLHRFSKGDIEAISKNEDTLDSYEDALGTYLVQLSSKRLSEADSLTISKMLHVINDFERLGDHALNLAEISEELHNKNLSFSPEACKEISVLISATDEILSITEQAYTNADVATAVRVEPLEQTIDCLVASIRNRHILRLQKGECSAELGIILSDMLANLERISDHCSNIAVTIIELSHNSFETHRYINALRADNREYNEAFKAFSSKYTI